MIRRVRDSLIALLTTVLAGTAPALAKGPAFTRVELSNGAVLIVSEQHNVPMVVVQVLIDAGSRRDPRGQEGAAYLTADLLTEGTDTRSALVIGNAVDTIGASLESSAGVDSAFVSLKTLTKHLDTGLDLLTDIMVHPSFPAAEVERRREAILASMKAAEDNPTHVASRRFTEELFAGEPYGHAADGTPASVAKLTRAQLLSFYRRYYLPESTIITVVGDVQPAQMKEAFERRLAGWRNEDPPAFDYGASAPDAPKVIAVKKPVPQASIVMGHRGISRANPDYYALMVMNFILGGGGFGSRLLDDIRTAAGLAYSVGSSFTAPKAVGSFRIEMQTKTASVRDALGRACVQLQKIRDDLVSEQEINDAKLYLTGSFPLQLDSNSEIAGFLSTVEFFGLGADYADQYLAKINAVTREDVQRVARQYLHPEALSLVVAGEVTAADLPSTACP